MPNPVLADLTTAVTNTEGVIDSAIALINGIAAKIQAAVDAALLNGATAAELAPLVAVKDDLIAKSDALAAAVAANP